jgi:hypothetical protein
MIAKQYLQNVKLFFGQITMKLQMYHVFLNRPLLILFFEELIMF